MILTEEGAVAAPVWEPFWNCPAAVLFVVDWGEYMHEAIQLNQSVRGTLFPPCDSLKTSSAASLFWALASGLAFQHR